MSKEFEWTEEPWRCPECGSDHVFVKTPQIPGGPPGDVLRIRHVSYRALCGACGVLWTAFYVAEDVEIEPPKKHYKQEQETA